MSKSRLIVNADDLGLSPSVNTAILDVYRAGNLSSATLMVNMPGTVDAVDRVKEYPGLAIGLHFCLTEGTALGGASMLTGPDGVFKDRPTLVKRTMNGQVTPADIRRELELQLSRARELGVRITHVDSHQHVHMVPRIFQAMRPVLEAEDLPVRLVDPPAGAVLASWKRPKKALKQGLNGTFAARNRCSVSGRTNDALVSIHDLDFSGPYDAATYRDLLKPVRADQVVELMVHPYILGNDVVALYPGTLEAKRPFLRRCMEEHAALTGAPLFEDHELIDYSRL